MRLEKKRLSGRAGEDNRTMCNRGDWGQKSGAEDGRQEMREEQKGKINQDKCIQESHREICYF